MKTETDSPPADETHVRATAWALGQLTPEENIAFEAEMAADADLAAYAGEMRQFSHLLAAEFPSADDSISLEENRRELVVTALSQATKPSFARRYWKSLAFTAAAASLALVLIPEALLWSNQEAPLTATRASTTPFFSGSQGINPSGNPAGLDLLRTTPAPPNSLSKNPSASFFMEEKMTSGVSPSSRGGRTLKSITLASSAGQEVRFRTHAEGMSADHWNYNLSLRGLDAEAGPATTHTESYQSLPRNGFHAVTVAPLSTFSIDVDTASYANVRRFLNDGQRPPEDAVRLEELVNYFPYEDAPPQDGKPFAVRVETTAAPWNPAHRLTRIAIKGKEIATTQRPASNLVFLVDVSGSMNEPNKLPLVQQSLRMLTERLTENDRVSLVTYAGSTAVVLPSTNGQEKTRILAAIDALSSGGSTNGAGGLELAYQQAAAHFIKDGVNRVILATDGDFNVGISSHDALLTFIQEKAKSGVFLSVLGYGRGNLKDDTMELLADKGNGNYGYIDSLSEARKTLVEQMSGTLVTIAKDVKIQIEFNPASVKSYRLLGYENRMLAMEDFNDDKKDAGEIGAGHNVTALYEIVPAGTPDAAPVPVVDGLKYQQVPAVTTPKPEPTTAALNGEMMTVKLRWKQPTGDTSELLEIPVRDTVTLLDQASQETRWSAAVAGFAQLLRGEAPPALTWEMVRQLARSAKGPDALGYRGEFLQLIEKAEGLSR